MRIQDSQLKKFIADSGMVSKTDLAAAAKIAKDEERTLAEALLAGGYLTEDDLRRIESYISGVPFVSLKNDKIDFEILSLIPEPIARNHNIIAYKINDGSLEVAMLDTADLPAIDFIKKKVGLKMLPRLTDTESMRVALRQYQKTLRDTFGNIIMKESSSLRGIAKDNDEEVSEAELRKLAEDMPVVRIVDTLLRHAVIQNASDIHIEPMEAEVIVRYRIDGVLHDAMTLPRNSAETIAARIKILTGLKLDQKRLPQDGRFKMEMDSQKVSFRVSILPIYFGEKIVMRLLRENRSGFNLEGIGFHGDTLERIHDAIKQTSGLILVTGPIGSGKTTSLYTMLDLLNSPEINISTIEDPIEYQMPRVNQTQVKPDIGFTFANGLRALMRQDPDIIMVGEIRDEETASLAINAALTGHLVLATVHANSASGTISRLIEMGVESFLLASTLRVSVGQCLVRRLAIDNCESYTLSANEKAELSKYVDMERILSVLKDEKIVPVKDTWSTVKFYRPQEDVGEEAYQGRIGIHEVLKVTPTLKAKITEGASAEELEEIARKEGMLTLLEDGIYKAARGITSIEEVFRVIKESY